MFTRYTPTIAKAFNQEIRTLRKLNHPNVVMLLGSCSDEEKLCVVTEWVDGGGLREGQAGGILCNKEIELNMADVLEMALDVARGMAYLHSINMFHRDLKSYNLLVDEDWTVKVTDFGTAKIVKDKTSVAHTTLGTSGWTAPEIYLSEGKTGYDKKVDIFSYGVCLWEFLTRGLSNPLSGLPPVAYCKRLKALERPPVPVWTPPIFKALLDRCWHYTPSERPEFTEIVTELEGILADNGLMQSFADLNVPVLYDRGY
jgi:serine/threonine protein kinase